MAEETKKPQAKAEAAEKLRAENAALKEQIKDAEAKNAELEAQGKRDAVIIAQLSSKVAEAVMAAERLKKLYAHGGPHDPVSKYD